jgi:hypothetical protein
METPNAVDDELREREGMNDLVGLLRRGPKRLKKGKKTALRRIAVRSDVAKTAGSDVGSDRVASVAG